MKILYRTSFITLLMLLTASCVTTKPPAADSMQVRTPVSVENGAFVPVSIHLPKGFAKNQALDILVNNELAVTVKISKDTLISRASVRVRMKQSGFISANIRSNNAIIEQAKSPYIKVDGFSDKAANLGASGTRHKLRVTSNKIRMLFVNEMKTDNYLEQVTIHTIEGDTTFVLTKIVSAHPYVSILLNGDPGEVKISAKQH